MPIFTDLDPGCSEEAFRAALVHVAQLLGYMHMHPRPCRVQRRGEDTYETAYDGNKGYPDESLVHEQTGFTIFAELKAKGGKASPEQTRWLEAMARGPVPTFLWRPSDWRDILKLLEDGARLPARAIEPEPEGAVVPVKGSSDPDYLKAEQTVRQWWDWHQANNNGEPPTAQKFIAVVKVVQQLYKAKWTTVDVKWALRDAPTPSVAAMEYARNMRRRKHGEQEHEIAEWHKRNAGKPLTEREPRPEPRAAQPEFIETTATEG